MKHRVKEKNIKNILNFAVFSLIIISLSLAFVILPDTVVSKAERRTLKSFEEVKTAENPFDEFEGYFLDQFPMRDTFRALKAYVNYNILNKNDNNKIYMYNGSIVKTEDTLDEKQVDKTASLINDVIEKYFKDKEVYYSIIPDKHFLASAENGYYAMDYSKLYGMMFDKVNGTYIDITNELELSDYYATDSHWRQENITDVAQILASAMSEEVNLTPENGYKLNTLEPFYGVYYGQYAMKVPGEKLNYLTTDNTEQITMTVVKDNGMRESCDLYTVEKFNNVDPYDVFTAGAQSLITIENPMASSDKELILFRDSFGSSIAPIFAEGYKKITMVDLRYMFPDALATLMRTLPEDADILFLYSTGLINGGGTLRGFINK